MFEDEKAAVAVRGERSSVTVAVKRSRFQGLYRPTAHQVPTKPGEPPGEERRSRSVLSLTSGVG